MTGDNIPIKKHYPKSSYRIDDEVKKYLRNMKYESGLSYNLIFHELINLHQDDRENKKTSSETGGEASKEI